MALLIAPVANVICSCICLIAIELVLAEVLDISEMECLTSSIVTCNVAEIFSMFFGKSAIAWVAEPN